MIGYSYFYGNENSDQDEKFMIFSLATGKKDSELNLTQLSSSLPILVEPFTLPLSDEYTYHLCNHISQICETFSVFSDTKTLVLDYDDFCKFASQSNIIMSTISSDLHLTKESAMQQAQNFFNDKNVIVQAGGIQGKI